MRLLILGTGHMANSHARNFIEIEGVTLAGAVDVDQRQGGSIPREVQHSSAHSPL